jgi:hypothetical protein
MDDAHVRSHYSSATNFQGTGHLLNLVNCGIAP